MNLRAHKLVTCLSFLFFTLVNLSFFHVGKTLPKYFSSWTS